MIQLFTAEMFMEPGYAAGPDCCLGKTLVLVAVHLRVHQLPNLGAVAGDIGSYLLSCCLHRLYFGAVAIN